MKPFVRDLYWFPKRHLSMMAVKKNFTVTLYEDAEEEEIIHVYRERTIGGEPWIGLPRGQPQLVKSCLLNPGTWKRIIDKRTTAPLKKFPLKFQSEFRDYQPPAIQALSRAIGGVLKSAPRTGKCVVGDTLICTSRGFIRAGAFRIYNATLQGCEITGSPRGHYRLPTHTGEVSHISGLYSYTKDTDVVTVRTHRGFEITCTPDEAFMTHSGEWVKAKDLKPGQLVELQSRVFTVNPRTSDCYIPPEYLEFSDYLKPTFGSLIGYLPWLDISTDFNPEPEHYAQVRISNPSCAKHVTKLLGYLNCHDTPRGIKLHGWLMDMINRYRDCDDGNCMSQSLLQSPFSVIKAYIKARYEVLGYVYRAGLMMDLGSERLAKEIQLILACFGVIVSREGGTLTGSVADKLSLERALGVDRNYNGSCEPQPKRYDSIEAVVPAGKQPVFDLEVEGQHSYVANGFLVHNTIMGTQAVINVAEKTLILAHQTDLIEQFCNETINDKSGNLFNGASCKKPIAKICKTYEDFKKHDICLATYQSFITPKGKKLLKKIKDMFGVVLIDEVHRAPADKYAMVLTRISAKRFWGLTATPDRKDGKYCQVADTTVVMADGSTRLIQHISIGDFVKSFNHMTGEIEERQVINKWVNKPSRIFEIEHENGTIRATAEHEVWCVNRNAYVMVKDLTAEDVLLIDDAHQCIEPHSIPTVR